MRSLFFLLVVVMLTQSLYGVTKRISSSVTGLLSLYPNLEYDYQVLDHWMISGSVFYRFKRVYDYSTNDKYAFVSPTIMVKRYFDTDLLGYYWGFGYQYKFYTLYSSEETGTEIEYTGGKLNENTPVVEFGYSDTVSDHIYLTWYVGVSNYLVLDSEIITDESGSRARMKTFYLPYLGISLGYQF